MNWEKPRTLEFILCDLLGVAVLAVLRFFGVLEWSWAVISITPFCVLVGAGTLLGIADWLFEERLI